MKALIAKVATGAALRLEGNLTVGGEALTIIGTGVGATGALRDGEQVVGR